MDTYLRFCRQAPIIVRVVICRCRKGLDGNLGVIQTVCARFKDENADILIFRQPRSDHEP